jgi:hypothetical protein
VAQFEIKKVDIVFHWLRSGWSGDRILVGARFFAHVQTGPGVHPATCTTGTESFPGVKRPGRGTDHPLSSSGEVKRVGFSVCYGVPLHFGLVFHEGLCETSVNTGRLNF